MDKRKEPCILYNTDKAVCVGIKVKSCDMHGNAVLPEGEPYNCPFYKNLEDEIRSQRLARARCEITGYMFVPNDKIDINIDEE